MLLKQTMRRLRDSILATVGSMIAITISMIVMTTSSSISVKPPDRPDRQPVFMFIGYFLYNVRPATRRRLRTERCGQYTICAQRGKFIRRWQRFIHPLERGLPACAEASPPGQPHLPLSPAIRSSFPIPPSA